MLQILEEKRQQRMLSINPQSAVSVNEKSLESLSSPKFTTQGMRFREEIPARNIRYRSVQDYYKDNKARLEPVILRRSLEELKDAEAMKGIKMTDSELRKASPLKSLPVNKRGGAGLATKPTLNRNEQVSRFKHSSSSTPALKSSTFISVSLSADTEAPQHSQLAALFDRKSNANTSRNNKKTIEERRKGQWDKTNNRYLVKFSEAYKPQKKQQNDCCKKHTVDKPTLIDE